jgi:hypothetical protein
VAGSEVRMRILSDGEERFITTREDTEASRAISDYWRAVDALNEREDPRPLLSREWLRVRDRETGTWYTLETDPDVIEELGRRGELSFESIYVDRV